MRVTNTALTSSCACPYLRAAAARSMNAAIARDAEIGLVVIKLSSFLELQLLAPALRSLECLCRRDRQNREERPRARKDSNYTLPSSQPFRPRPDSPPARPRSARTSWASTPENVRPDHRPSSDASEGVRARAFGWD